VGHPAVVTICCTICWAKTCCRRAETRLGLYASAPVGLVGGREEGHVLLELCGNVREAGEWNTGHGQQRCQVRYKVPRRIQSSSATVNPASRSIESRPWTGEQPLRGSARARSPWVASANGVLPRVRAAHESLLPATTGTLWARAADHVIVARLGAAGHLILAGGVDEWRAGIDTVKEFGISSNGGPANVHTVALVLLKARTGPAALQLCTCLAMPPSLQVVTGGAAALVRAISYPDRRVRV
jgi:hypothetical protein